MGTLQDSVIRKKHRSVRRTASTLASYLPGYFKFASGKNPRIIYIEEEFDKTKEADAADRLYEGYIRQRDKGDYTYPGAYDTPNYLAARKAWVDFAAARDSMLQKIRTQEMAEMLAIPFSDTAARRGVKTRFDALRERETAKLFKASGSPTEVPYENWKNPIHPFSGRIFRVSLTDRIIEYYNVDGGRSKVPLLSVQPVRDADKIRMMDTAVAIPPDVADIVAAGGTPEFPDNTTLRLQDLLQQMRAGPTYVSYPFRVEIVRDVYRLDYSTMYATDVERYKVLNSFFENGANVPPEILEYIERRVKARSGLLQLSAEYLQTIKENAEAGYYKSWDVSDGSGVQPGSPLPSALRSTVGSDDSVTPSPPFLPLREVARHPHLRAHVKGEIDALDEHLSGSAHERTRGRNFKASDAWDDDNYYASARIALAEHAKYRSYVSERDRLIRVRENAKPADCPTIPHLQQGTQFFPHQALALAQLDASEETAIIDIDMGGGKTIICCIADAMNCVRKGLARRPAVVMPGNTIPQQVDEIMHKFGENVNVIAITSDAWNEWDKETPDGADVKDTVRRIITNAPPNTIILISYSWLASNPTLIPTGEYYEKGKKAGKPKMMKIFWKSTWLIDECGVDMVTLDESHRAKNPASDTNASVCGLSGARVRRIASGTIFPNSPADIFGQMMFLDPNFFGAWDEFCEKYEIETDQRGNPIGFSGATLKAIRQDLITHAGMISMRRSYWMHMLPERVERRHAVRLSPILQKFYNLIWREILSQLTDPKNPFYDEKVAKAWEAQQQAGDDEDESNSKGEAQLLQKILVLDQFLCNPSASIGGKLTERVTNPKDPNGPKIEVSRRDKIPATFLRIRQMVAKASMGSGASSMISPKVRKIAEICDAHLSDPDARMTARDGTDMGPGKIIVFVQLVESAEHIAKHLPSFSSKVKTANIVYYEGGMTDSLEAFKNDPNVKVLVAVDKSLREGHNLQVANCAIRADILWSPGPTEQVFGRVFRPGSLAKKVFIHTILTEGTGEVAKYGRLLCKYHYMRKINSEFMDEVELMPILMNPVTLSPWSDPDEKGNITKNEGAILELDQIQPFIERYDAAYSFDLQESLELSRSLGRTMLTRTDPQPLAGAGQILGWMPDYQQRDVIEPMRVKSYPAKGTAKPYLIIDDSWTVEKLGSCPGDIRALGLKYVSADGHSYFTRPTPKNMPEWINECYDLAWTHVEIMEMNAKGVGTRCRLYDREGKVIGEYGPSEKPVLTNIVTVTVNEDGEEEEELSPGLGTMLPPAIKGGQKSTPPQEYSAPPPEPAAVADDDNAVDDNAEVQVVPEVLPMVKVKKGWELVAVIAEGVNAEGQHSAYAAYRKPATMTSGKSGFEYVLRWHFDEDEDVLRTDIRNVDAGGIKVKGIKTDKKVGPVTRLAIPDAVLAAFEKAIADFDDDFEDGKALDWTHPTRSELMGVTTTEQAPTPESTSTTAPQRKPKNDVPPPPPASEAVDGPTYADNVIEQMRVVTLNGITYLAVDSGEDDSEDLRRLGFRFFNSFLYRPFKNITEAKRTLSDLESKGVEVKNEDEWESEVRRVLGNRAFKGKETRARTQLSEMRRLRKLSAKAPKVTLHVIAIGAEWATAVRIIESDAALNRVRTTPRFNNRLSGTWVQVLNRNAAKVILKQLAKDGVQIANWKQLVKDLEAAFSYTPEVDLKLISRPPGSKARVVHSGPLPSAVDVDSAGSTSGAVNP